MARTIQEIYDAIIIEKEQQSALTALQPNIDKAQTLLADLNTSSKVSIWRLMFWVFAVAVWIHETFWDKFKTEIETLKQQAVPGGAAWLQDEAFKFQMGDVLTVINYKYQYATIDQSKQIIKRCAVIDTLNSVIVKVAKLNDSVPVELTTDEFTAFETYMLYYKRFAGVSMSVISLPADVLKLKYDIYYNPQYELATVKTDIENAINGYLSGLKFNGNLLLTRLTDSIQDVASVVDLELKEAYYKPSNSAYVAINRICSPVSGYFKIDGDFPISDNFNFKTDV